jgi:hypothetical protein
MSDRLFLIVAHERSGVIGFKIRPRVDGLFLTGTTAGGAVGGP